MLVTFPLPRLYLPAISPPDPSFLSFLCWLLFAFSLHSICCFALLFLYLVFHIFCFCGGLFVCVFLVFYGIFFECIFFASLAFSCCFLLNGSDGFSPPGCPCLFPCHGLEAFPQLAGWSVPGSCPFLLPGTHGKLLACTTVTCHLCFAMTSDPVSVPCNMCAFCVLMELFFCLLVLIFSFLFVFLLYFNLCFVWAFFICLF